MARFPEHSRLPYVRFRRFVPFATKSKGVLFWVVSSTRLPPFSLQEVVRVPFTVPVFSRLFVILPSSPKVSACPPCSHREPIPKLSLKRVLFLVTTTRFLFRSLPSTVFCTPTVPVNCFKTKRTFLPKDWPFVFSFNINFPFSLFSKTSRNLRSDSSK